MGTRKFITWGIEYSLHATESGISSNMMSYLQLACMQTLPIQTVIMIVPFSNNVFNKSFTDMFYSVCSLSSSSGQGLPLDELQNYLGSAVIVFNLQKKALVFSSIFGCVQGKYIHHTND